MPGRDGWYAEIPERAVANWRAVCTMAHLPMDTKFSAQQIVDAMRHYGHAHWTVIEIERMHTAWLRQEEH